MKLNRKLVLVLALILSLALATGSTLAYLSDTDKDVNVMTLGSVEIDQIEKERVEQSDDNTDSTNIEDFTQNKPLYPAVGEAGWAEEYQQWPTGGSNQLFSDDLSNVVDKFVFVENTGKSPAYVRSIFAFELGNLTFAEWDQMIHLNINASTWTWSEFSEENVITIDGSKYVLVSAVYTGTETVHPDGILPAGETTRPSLLQIYLDSAATNETVENLDGNANGMFDVLVVSQAIQTQGFSDPATALDTGFGVVSTTSHPWMDGQEGDQEPDEIVVTSDAELLAAIQDPDVTDIVIDGELTYDWGGKSYENSEALLLKGMTIRGADLDSSITFKGYGSANPIVDVTFEYITIKDETAGDNEGSWEHGHLEFEGLTARNVVFANSIMLAGDNKLSSCSMDNQQASWYGVWVEGGNTTFSNCTFTGTRAIKIHEAYGTEVASVTVKNCTFTLSEKPGVVIGDLNADTTVTITGSTFATQPGDQSKYIYESDTDVTTFNFSESGNTVK